MYLTTGRDVGTALLAIGAVFVLSLRTSAQQPSGIRELARQLESMEYRPLAVPARLELGGWVVPGHEQLGSVLRRETLDVLAPWHEKEVPVMVQGEFGLGKLGMLTARLDAKDRHDIGGITVCRDATVRLTRLRETSITSDTRRSAGEPNVLASVAQKIDVSAEALDGAVVVWGIVHGDAVVQGCSNDAARSRVEQALGQLVWGYRAGLPTDFRGAVGKGPAMSILKPFELNGLAKARTVRIKSIDTAPAGGRVAYLGRLQAIGRDPQRLPDDEYVQLGEAPTGPVDMWAGRFFVRILQGGRRQTVTRDIALADRDKVLRLTIPTGQ